MGGLADAGAWGLAWAALVAVIGCGALTAAALLLRPRAQREPDWFEGYDAMSAPPAHPVWLKA